MPTDSMCLSSCMRPQTKHNPRNAANISQLRQRRMSTKAGAATGRTRARSGKQDAVVEAPAKLPQTTEDRLPPLSISLFGGVTLRVNNKLIDLNNRKAKALIAYLVLTPDLKETRERLIGMLWSETEDFKARASLRQLLHVTRDALETAGYSGFASDRFLVRLDPEGFVTDVISALESVDGGEPQELLLNQTRVTDTLLAGFDDVDPLFESWLRVQRENLRQRFIRNLETKLGNPAQTQRQVKRIAQALLQMDPTHEAACRHLMRICADTGDIAGALSAYKQLWDLLEQDYDMEPSAATQELVAAIKSGEYKPQPEAANPQQRRMSQSTEAAGSIRTARATKLGLMVGHFEADSEHANLATALRHDLISKLVRFREWVLLDAQLASAATQNVVHVRYVVTAKLLTAMGQMALVSSLHDHESGLIVWSDRHDLQRERAAEAHQAIVNRIAASFNIHLSVDRLTRLSNVPDISLETYDRWLRAQALMQSYEPENRERAAAMLHSINDDEPNFAPAYSGLAQLDNSHHIVFAGIYRTVERQLRATTLARRAISLDPLDSRGQLCLAWAHAMSDRHELSETYFRMAYELNIDDPWTTTSAALGLAFCGKYKDAGVLADQARDRVPCPSPIHWSYQAQIRFLCGDYEGCIRAGEHVEGVIRYIPAWRAAALSHLQRHDEARAELQHFFELIRASWYGTAAPTDQAIGRWFLRCFPIREGATEERLQSGLRSAGVTAIAPTASA